MARSRIHSQVWRLPASVVVTVTSLQLVVAASSAEQFDKAAEYPNSPRQLANSAALPGAVDAVFRNRWLNSGRQYVIGTDGKIQSVDTPLAARRAEGENVAVTGVGSVAEESHFDVYSTGTGYSCGPSQLTTSQIAQLVVGVARRHGVDPDFALAIATTESRLDRDRNSPKGARGPMQLMPSTAAFLGVTDICDPAENIDGGVRFLKSLFETYRNPLIVAAAYNAGEANVQKYGGVPPFPETVRFVAEVVIRQLGLPAPKMKGQSAGAAPVPIALDDAITGVLPTGKSRQWVGGVMQF